MLKLVPGIVTRISSSKTSTEIFDFVYQDSFMAVLRINQTAVASFGDAGYPPIGRARQMPLPTLSRKAYLAAGKRCFAAIWSSSFARSSPINRAPGPKLVPSSIMTGPLGPLILMGFVQDHSPFG